MEKSEIRKEIQEEIRKSEKILVGIGAEWKRGDEDREGQIRRASKALRKLLDGKDAFIISTLTLRRWRIEALKRSIWWPLWTYL